MDHTASIIEFSTFIIIKFLLQISENYKILLNHLNFSVIEKSFFLRNPSTPDARLSTFVYSFPSSR